MDKEKRTEYKGMTWEQIYPNQEIREKRIFTSQFFQEQERKRKEKKARELYQLKESLKNTEYF